MSLEDAESHACSRSSFHLFLAHGNLMSGQYDVFSPGQSISVISISILSSSKMQSPNTFAASFIHDHSVLYGFGFPRNRTVQKRATKQRQYPRLRAKKKKKWNTNFKENRSSGSSAQAIITSEADLVEQYDLDNAG
ncbi:alpha-1,3 mannosyltransferase [Histoplasma capsulatum var. duboisii H88]|uniref:Alpha-1,3 mannosyltransferase n=1 Tax=Ajellomyces capsulatus (strain H88) TaxID=544711 RepID=A0A8A1LKB7_AJEC8|nr:alpha-1,3 mannosyltransferase [Histoplasma capsulatum var. duboisii H88]